MLPGQVKGFKVQKDVVEEKGYSAFRIPDLDLVSPNKTHGFEIHMESREKTKEGGAMQQKRFNQF